MATSSRDDVEVAQLLGNAFLEGGGWEEAVDGVAGRGVDVKVGDHL